MIANVEVTGNTFASNFDSLTFYEQHELERASHIMALGVHQYLLRGNKFEYNTGIFEVLGPDKMPTYASYLPKEVFKYPTSPLIRMTVPRKADDFKADLLMNAEEDFLAFYKD